MNKHKLLLLPRGWNTRVFTERDFFELCDRDDVMVFCASLPVPGFYCVHRGQPLIFFDRDLTGPQRLLVMFHEIGHHWLHCPGIQFFLGHHGKCEFEANLIAACALIPRPLLIRFSLNEIAEEYGYPEELLRFRMEVFYRTGL